MPPRTLRMTGTKPVMFEIKGQAKGVHLKGVGSQTVQIYEDTMMKFTTSTEKLLGL